MLGSHGIVPKLFHSNAGEERVMGMVEQIFDWDYYLPTIATTN